MLWFVDLASAARKRVNWEGTHMTIESGFTVGTFAFLRDLEANNGKNWFDLFDYIASNWLLPLGGLGIALFALFFALRPSRG